MPTILNDGYRGAALTHGANYNAQEDYMNNKNDAARLKMGQSENVTSLFFKKILICRKGSVYLW